MRLSKGKMLFTFRCRHDDRGHIGAPALLDVFDEFGKRLVGRFIFEFDPGSRFNQFEILNSDPLRGFIVLEDLIRRVVDNPNPNRVVLCQPILFLIGQFYSNTGTDSVIN